MYTITFTDTADKQFSKLPKTVKERVSAVLDRIRIRPHSHLKKLVGNPFYAARVGDYRIILDIVNNDLKIFVIEIGMRDKIYD